MIYLIVISLMLGAIWLLIHFHNKKKTDIQNMSDAELFEPIRPIVSPRNETENFVQSFQPNIPQRFSESSRRLPSTPQRIQNSRSWPTQQVSNHSSYNDSNSFPDPVKSLIIGSVLSNVFETESRSCCDDFSSSSSDYSSSCSDYSSDSSSSYSCDSSSSDSGSCSCSD